MGANTVEQLTELMVAAYQAKDAAAVADLYEEDAILANSVAGYSIVGREAIRERVKENFAVDAEFFGMDELLTEDFGNCVVGHAVFRRRVTLPDGTRHEGEGRGTVVFRRGADGTLRLLVDHA